MNFRVCAMLPITVAMRFKIIKDSPIYRAVSERKSGGKSGERVESGVGSGEWGGGTPREGGSWRFTEIVAPVPSKFPGLIPSVLVTWSANDVGGQNPYFNKIPCATTREKSLTSLLRAAT
jgi:hypothetical protein